MTPDSGGVFHGLMYVWGNFADKLVESNDTHFFQSVHASYVFYVGVPVRGDGGVVFVPNFVRNVLGIDVHILEVVQVLCQFQGSGNRVWRPILCC